MSVFRRRVGDVFVVAELRDDGTWRIEVTDAASRPSPPEKRKLALEAILDELSSLRAHIWKTELGRN